MSSGEIDMIDEQTEYEKRLLKRAEKAEALANHWRANHDNQVKRARILMDRPDLPLERVRAYELVVALTEEVAELKRKLSELGTERDPFGKVR
jgi:hypothetical protein